MHFIIATVLHQPQSETTSVSYAYSRNRETLAHSTCRASPSLKFLSCPFYLKNPMDKPLQSRQSGFPLDPISRGHLSQTLALCIDQSPNGASTSPQLISLTSFFFLFLGKMDCCRKRTLLELELESKSKQSFLSFPDSRTLLAFITTTPICHNQVNAELWSLF